MINQIKHNKDSPKNENQLLEKITHQIPSISPKTIQKINKKRNQFYKKIQLNHQKNL
jgi:hypothetical protein